MSDIKGESKLKARESENILKEQEGVTICGATTREEKEEVFRIRRIVFVGEQRVPIELEMDAWDDDPSTIHLLAKNGNHKAVGCLRFRPLTGQQGVGKVERVAVLKEVRGKKIGRLLMEAVEEMAKKEGYQRLKLHAQHQVIPFYEGLGYYGDGDLFDEAGILHLRMEKDLKDGAGRV